MKQSNLKGDALSTLLCWMQTNLSDIVQSLTQDNFRVAYYMTALIHPYATDVFLYFGKDAGNYHRLDELSKYFIPRLYCTCASPFHIR